VNDEEYLVSLLKLNSMVLALSSHMEYAAAVAKSAEATGLAFACLMLRESILAYGTAVADYIETRG
jgi:hypothetical protein